MTYRIPRGLELPPPSRGNTKSISRPSGIWSRGVTSSVMDDVTNVLDHPARLSGRRPTYWVSLRHGEITDGSYPPRRHGNEILHVCTV